MIFTKTIAVLGMLYIYINRPIIFVVCFKLQLSANIFLVSVVFTLYFCTTYAIPPFLNKTFLRVCSLLKVFKGLILFKIIFTPLAQRTVFAND